MNVVDLMALFPPRDHPHGMSDEAFVELFTADTPVVFAFHGYQRPVHQLVHGRPHAGRFHVRGFNEQGTTTTPFDMVVLNEMSRYHCARGAAPRRRAPARRGELDRALPRARPAPRYMREHFEDMPEVRDWSWSEP